MIAILCNDRATLIQLHFRQKSPKGNEEIFKFFLGTVELPRKKATTGRYRRLLRSAMITGVICVRRS
jgi:hypothetical protein